MPASADAMTKVSMIKWLGLMPIRPAVSTVLGHRTQRFAEKGEFHERVKQADSRRRHGDDQHALQRKEQAAHANNMIAVRASQTHRGSDRTRAALRFRSMIETPMVAISGSSSLRCRNGAKMAALTSQPTMAPTMIAAAMPAK